jgi:hypothetical protein
LERPEDNLQGSNLKRQGQSETPVRIAQNAITFHAVGFNLALFGEDQGVGGASAVSSGFYAVCFLQQTRDAAHQIAGRSGKVAFTPLNSQAIWRALFRSV